MPDVTVSFTDAQWARIVAASISIKQLGASGDVDADYLAARWKEQVQRWVLGHEAKNTDVAAWE